MYNIPYTTTIAGARAVSEAIRALQKEDWQVRPLQEYYAKSAGSSKAVKDGGKKKPQTKGKKNK
jgi:hypothetical protein